MGWDGLFNQFSKHHLRPKSRKQVVDSFRTLVRELLGQDVNAAADSEVGQKKGVTVLSHSKFVLFYSLSKSKIPIQRARKKD